MFDKNESLTAVTHIGQNIARFRGLRRMTQKEMADKLNIAQPVYSKIEQKAKVDDEMLQRISDVLNIPAEVIKNFTEEAIINNINCHFADNAINTVYNVNPNEKLIDYLQSVIEQKDSIITEQSKLIESFIQIKKG